MTELRSPLKSVVLADAKALEVLLDPRQRTALLPFVGEACSVAQAARRCGEKPNTMLYRVKRWLGLGLLLDAGRVPHPTGKGQMTLYRSSADAYFVPHTATRAEDLLALAEGVYLPLFQDFLAAFVLSGKDLPDEWGARFERSSTGSAWAVRPVISVDYLCDPADAAAPPTLLEAQQLQLSPTDAKAMQRELLAVLSKYQHKYQRQTTPQCRSYQVVLGIG